METPRRMPVFAYKKPRYIYEASIIKDKISPYAKDVFRMCEYLSGEDEEGNTYLEFKVLKKRGHLHKIQIVLMPDETYTVKLYERNHNYELSLTEVYNYIYSDMLDDLIFAICKGNNSGNKRKHYN